jgi:hypothetical protein
MVLPLIAVLIVSTGALDQSLFTESHEIYKKVAGSLLGVLTLATLSRVAYYKITASSAGAYGNLLSQTLKYFVWILGFPFFMGTVISFSETLATEINPSIATGITQEEIEKAIPRDLEISFIGFELRKVAALCSLYLAAIIGGLLELARNFVLAALIALAPLFIFLGFILGVSFFQSITVNLTVTLAIWPIMSAVLARLAMNIAVTPNNAENEWALTHIIATMSYALLQLAIPALTTYSLFHGTNSFANMVSGFASGSGKLGRATGSLGVRAAGAAGSVVKTGVERYRERKTYSKPSGLETV